MKKELKPRKVRALTKNCESWMYVNDNSIDIFIGEKGKDALSARITRRQLDSILNH